MLDAEKLAISLDLSGARPHTLMRYQMQENLELPPELTISDVAPEEISVVVQPKESRSEAHLKTPACNISPREAPSQ